MFKFLLLVQTISRIVQRMFDIWKDPSEVPKKIKVFQRTKARTVNH